MVVSEITGRGAAAAFEGEAGGHRWQRVPVTEKKGRVQSSTVTVAVLVVPDEKDLRLDEKDLDWKMCRGSGAGGQHRNVTDSAVQLTHKPSGIQVRCESERSQLQNKATALGQLRARLQQAADADATNARNAGRKAQVGSGERSDKGRTVQVQNDVVVDHRTGRRMRVKEYLRGELEAIRG